MLNHRGDDLMDATGIVEVTSLKAAAVIGGFVSPSGTVFTRIGSPLDPCRVATGDVNGDGVPDVR